jgi:hypothetical protein
VDHIVNESVSLAEIMGLEVDNNDVKELVEEHSQELTIEELTELHRVSQKEIERSLSGMEEVTAKPNALLHFTLIYMGKIVSLNAYPPGTN